MGKAKKMKMYIDGPIDSGYTENKMGNCFAASHSPAKKGVSAMKKHKGKLVAPIVISVFLIFYYLGFLLACIFLPLPLPAKILGGVFPLALGGVCVFVLAERIREIKSGEEDDLSQY